MIRPVMQNLQSADQLGGDLLGGAAEECLGERWRGDYRRSNIVNVTLIYAVLG